jgi:hypothetical protein
MPNTTAALWPGYEDASEDDLLGLLESKVDAALDENDTTVDKRLAKDFAQAIASYEWLKENKLADGDHRSRLHARANEVRVESWRPREPADGS